MDSKNFSMVDLLSGGLGVEAQSGYHRCPEVPRRQAICSASLAKHH